MLYDDITKSLHRKNPFDGFLTDELIKQTGFGGDLSPVLQGIDERRQNKTVLVVEVGSWLGYSAEMIGTRLKNLRPGSDTCLICVDTWLGSSDFIVNKDGKRSKQYDELEMKNGYPRIYYSFMSAIMNSGLSDVVVPFAMTSVGAADVLHQLKISADIVFIDAGHTYEDVSMDITSWSKIVKSDGLLVGDDIGFPGVKKAVEEFSTKRGNRYVRRNRYWIMPFKK